MCIQENAFEIVVHNISTTSFRGGRFKDIYELLNLRALKNLNFV